MLCQSTSTRIAVETTCRSTEKEMITMSGLSCLVCDANLDVSSCANVFYTSLPRSGEPLVNFVSRVLRVTLADLRGSYVCSQCYNLFEMLEQAQRTVASIRCEIFKAYCANGRDKAMKQTLNEESDLSMGNAVPEQQNLVQQAKSDDTEGLWLKRIDNLAPDNTDASYRIEEKILSFGLDSLPVDTNFDTNIDKDSKRDVKGRIEDEKEIDAKGEKYDKSVLINEIFRDSITNESKEYVRNNVQTKGEPYNHARCKLCGKILFLNNECDARLSKCNSQTYQCEKCKKNFPNISVASTNANTMHNEEKNNGIAITETIENETRSATRAESIFHENKLQTADIPESVDFAWNHIEESLTEAKTGPGDESTQHTEGKQGKSSRCNSKTSKYSCPTCGKKWKTSAELKTHIKTHSTLRPYMCEKCGQAYKHKHALEIHVGMHNGINPFKCSFCNKCFTQKGALMRHLPMHTGEKPYQCELCGKRFIHHTSYNMHRLSHTGKKSYKCHVCDMSLLSTSHLKRHMRVHTGEKPYNCTLCGKRFAERYNLLAHQKIHDPSETKSKKIEKSRYKCDSTFEEKQSLDDHLKFHPDSNGVAKEKEYPIQTENAIGEGWVQVNRSKLENIDGQAKFVLLPNSLAQIHDDSFAVAFTDEKITLENGNYNASLQVIIQSSDAPVLSNHVTVDNTQI